MIGDSIEITIVEIKGDKVRIGINAPAEIPVHRKEIYDAIRRENIEAAATEPANLEQAAGLFKNSGSKSVDNETGESSSVLK